MRKQVTGLSLLMLLFAFTFQSCGGGGGEQQTGGETKQQEETSAKKESTDKQQDGALSEMEKEMEQMEEPASEEGGEVAEVTLEALGNTMAEMRYDKDKVTVPAGSKVKLKLVNKGENAAMMHNVVIAKKGSGQTVATNGIKAGKDNEYVPQNSDNVIAATTMSGPGETVELTFEAPEKGTYTFLCTYPGHYPKMKGSFIVQ